MLHEYRIFPWMLPDFFPSEIDKVNDHMQSLVDAAKKASKAR